jgi:uncharacterized membrane protein YphA (DoxX/SURF4 family)
LLPLCAAYLQGGLKKLLEFPGAIAELAHFGLHLAPLFAAIAIVTELGGSLRMLSGWDELGCVCRAVSPCP